ncbi:MAG: PDZ domain-containing protein [Candidatus Aminicenantes bacterium]|nr:PDZ domain-containing protein [Candidatus Aminicenantes bacterium]
MLKNKIRFFLLSLAVAVPLFFMVEMKFFPENSPKTSPKKTFELMVDVTRLIKSQYITETDPVTTMSGAFRGLVDSLDIMSSYLTPDQLSMFQQRRDPEIHETGVILYKHYGLYPRVIGLVKESPAEKAGLEIGDSITAVDNQSTLLMSLIETRLLMQSRRPEEIQLKVVRANKTLDVSLGKIILHNNHYSLGEVEKNMPVLVIHHFYAPLVRQIRENILPRFKGKTTKLIIDLRNCGEGDIEEAVEFLDIFIDSDTIGYFTKKGKKSQSLDCSQPPALPDLKLFVWTDFGTMGPAEIVAGALKEAKRAKIIGRITPGLASKQTLFILEDGSGLLLTSEIFHLASGKKVWDAGIKPDVSIPSDSRGDEIYLQKTRLSFPQ